jgi:drug/metabolite transporter (DMT)-like permease
VFGLASGDTSYVRSLSLLGLAQAYTLSTAGYVVLAYSLAVALLGEPVGLQQALGAVVVLAGIAMVASVAEAEPAPGPGAPVHTATPSTELRACPERSEGTSPSTPLRTSLAALREGLIFATLAALCWGLNTTALKVLLVGVDVLTANLVRIPVAALALNAASLYYHGRDFRAYDARTAVVVSLAGLLGLGAGSLLFLYAIQEAGAAKTAVLSSTSPLFAAALAVTFLGERLTPRLAGGAALAVAGMVLVA